MTVRTRFAPSPTGFIHLGNLRSALYPWAFARKMQGDFILRIEDTDQERSSQEAVDVIIEGMKWLGLDIDEGPIYQMQRMDRYREVIAQMLQDGLAYYCYMSEEELNALREQQMANKEKPRYNGFWRPEPGKDLPAPPSDVKPVIRFKNPIGGSVVWDDAVKGRIEISNDELDDLVIARPDGTPTYNFCVVVDDLDMKITHVIRGDDHVNNTPRQINILKALGGQSPIYAHLPTVLNDQGEKMSKRNGAMSVRDYEREGYMPEAVLNYLARLGWSHGDAEVFTKEQFVEWFNLDHLGKSPAQHNPEKLLWLNHHYIQQADAADLAKRALPFAQNLGIKTDNGPDFVGVVNILKDRANTLIEIADGAKLFYMGRPEHSAADLEANVPEAIRPAISDFITELEAGDGSKTAVSAAFKAVLAKHGLKMPALAMPVRYAMFATTQTPAIDAVDLAKRALPFAQNLGIKTDNGPDFVGVVNILKDRANTLIEIAEGARLFYMDRPEHSAADLESNIPEAIRPAISDFIAELEAGDGSKTAVSAAFKAVLAKHGLKMPALAMPVRYAMFATTQTPAIDAVISLIGIEETKERLQRSIKIG